jgi:hypothetical protein
MKLKREMVPITAIGVGLVASAAILTPLALHWKKQNYYTLNDAYVSQLKSVSDLLTKSREALATKTA